MLNTLERETRGSKKTTKTKAISNTKEFDFSNPSQAFMLKGLEGVQSNIIKDESSLNSSIHHDVMDSASNQSSSSTVENQLSYFELLAKEVEILNLHHAIYRSQVKAMHMKLREIAEENNSRRLSNMKKRIRRCRLQRKSSDRFVSTNEPCENALNARISSASSSSLDVLRPSTRTDTLLQSNTSSSSNSSHNPGEASISSVGVYPPSMNSSSSLNSQNSGVLVNAIKIKVEGAAKSHDTVSVGTIVQSTQVDRQNVVSEDCSRRSSYDHCGNSATDRPDVLTIQDHHNSSNEKRNIAMEVDSLPPSPQHHGDSSRCEHIEFKSTRSDSPINDGQRDRYRLQDSAGERESIFNKHTERYGSSHDNESRNDKDVRNRYTSNGSSLGHSIPQLKTSRQNHHNVDRTNHYNSGFGRIELKRGRSRSPVNNRQKDHPSNSRSYDSNNRERDRISDRNRNGDMNVKYNRTERSNHHDNGTYNKYNDRIINRERESRNKNPQDYDTRRYVQLRKNDEHSTKRARYNGNSDRERDQKSNRNYRDRDDSSPTDLRRNDLYDERNRPPQNAEIIL
jgi:hypothetical protein